MQSEQRDILATPNSDRVTKAWKQVHSDLALSQLILLQYRNQTELLIAWAYAMLHCVPYNCPLRRQCKSKLTRLNVSRKRMPGRCDYAAIQRRRLKRVTYSVAGSRRCGRRRIDVVLCVPAPAGGTHCAVECHRVTDGQRTAADAFEFHVGRRRRQRRLPMYGASAVYRTVT